MPLYQSLNCERIFMTPLAEAQFAWICECLDYDGDECRIWPFYRLKGGYGKTTKFFGEQYLVHRLICRIVHGEPPTDKHESAHSCGHGSMGCATRRHLVWRSPSENRMDKRQHGTWWKGGNKLTPDQVQQIIALKNVEKQRVIAKRFGITQSNVSMIVNRRSWWLLEMTGQ